MHHRDDSHTATRNLRAWPYVLFCYIACALGLAGWDMSITGYAHMTPEVLLLEALLATIAITCVCILLRPLARWLSRKLRAPERPRGLFASLTWTKGGIAKLTLIMFACWLVWLVALYPGTMAWDTAYQISQCYDEAHPITLMPWWPTDTTTSSYYSDHNPIFDTLLFGFFAQVSQSLTGTWNAGIFCYAVAQQLLTALAFTMTIAYMRSKMGLSRRGAAVAYLLFCVVPVYPIYALTMLKDSLFGFLYAFYFLAVLHVVNTKGGALKGGKFVFALTLLAVLLSLTKKPGVYVAVITGAMLLVVYRRHAIKALLPVVIPALVMWVVLPYAVFPALDVAPGGRQEMYAIQFQQTARYVSKHADELTEQEAQAIDAVLGIGDLAERYNPWTADDVKFEWNYDATDEQIAAYLQVWWEQGLKDPVCYTAAWVSCICGYVSPVYDIEPHVDLPSLQGILPAQYEGMMAQPAELEGFRDAMTSLYATLASVPVVGVLLMLALYSLWVPGISLIFVGRNAKRLLPAFIPVALSFAIIMVTPVTDPRYALPLMYNAPVLLALMTIAAGWGGGNRDADAAGLVEHDSDGAVIRPHDVAVNRGIVPPAIERP